MKTAILLTLISACDTLNAQPANYPVRIERLAFVSEAQQRQNTVQHEFTDWFLSRVRAYQLALSGYAVGAIVNLGDFSAYRNRMYLYGGAPDWIVIWRDRRGRGPSKEPGQPFLFPNDDNIANLLNPDNVGTFNTCWHELQHGLLGTYTLTSPPPDEPAEQEHTYIEGLAQNTVTWLLELNKDRRFEAYARRAFDQQEEQRRKGVQISYELERQIWAPARDAWSLSMRTARDILALEDALRNEYLQYTGVRVPTMEEVIAFYMAGNLRTASKQPVRVPQWVMSLRPVMAPVSFGHDSRRDSSTVSQGILRHATRFHVKAVAIGARKVTPVTRGQLTVRLESDDDLASLGLRLGTAPLSGVAGPGGPSNRLFQLDLASYQQAFAEADTFDLTLIHRKAAALQGRKTFRVIVNYHDGGAEPVYAPSSAVLLIDVKGAAAPAAAKPAGQKSAAGATAVPAGTGLEGVWRGAGVGGARWRGTMTDRVWSTKQDPRSTRPLPAMQFAVSVNRAAPPNAYHVQLRPDLGFLVRLSNSFRRYRHPETNLWCEKTEYSGEAQGFGFILRHWKSLDDGREWIDVGANDSVRDQSLPEYTHYSADNLTRSGQAPVAPPPAPVPAAAETAQLASQSAMQAPDPGPVPPELTDVPPQNGAYKAVTVRRITVRATGRRPRAEAASAQPPICGPAAAWNRADIVEAGAGSNTAGANFPAGAYWTYVAAVESNVASAQWKWKRTGPWALAGGSRYSLNHTGAAGTLPDKTTRNDASLRFVNGASAPVAFYVCRDGGVPAQGAALRVALEVDRTTAKQNDTVVIQAKPTGGTPPYRYQWSDEGKVSGAQSSYVRWKAIVAGSHQLAVKVTDAAGGTAEAVVEIPVEPLGRP